MANNGSTSYVLFPFSFCFQGYFRTNPQHSFRKRRQNQANRTVVRSFLRHSPSHRYTQLMRLSFLGLNKFRRAYLCKPPKLSGKMWESFFRCATRWESLPKTKTIQPRHGLQPLILSRKAWAACPLLRWLAQVDPESREAGIFSAKRWSATLIFCLDFPPQRLDRSLAW